MRLNPLDPIQYLYTLLLYLYPANFRREFSSEMAQVFLDASRQAQQAGIQSLLAFLLKEILDFPSSLLHEHAWALFRKEPSMSESVQLESNAGGLSASLGLSSPPFSWKDALLAALPSLAIAFSGLTTLLSGLGVASSESPLFRILSPVLGVTLLLVGLGVFIFAWRKHWPRWSAAWYVFWLVAALAPLSFLSNLPGFSDTFYVFVQPFLWAFILMGIAWFLYRLSCQDAVKAILAALPVMGMTWFLHQEFVGNALKGTITLASWLLVAVCAVLILRLNSLRAGLLLALVTNVLIGLAYAYEGIYFGGTLNFDAPGPNWIQVQRSFLPQWVAVSTLVLGPLLARQIREIGYRLQPAGLWMYRLVLAGLLLLIAISVAVSMIYTTDSLRLIIGDGQVISVLAWIGLGITIIGFTLFSLKAIREKAVRSGWILLLLGLCSLYVPFALLVMPLAGFSLSLPLFWYAIWSGLHGISPIQQFPELWLVALGVLWVIVASWLVIYLEASNRPAPKLVTPG
jgi:hypothetical protein